MFRVHSFTSTVYFMQNVKSTTIPVRGNRPTWEQEFILYAINAFLLIIKLTKCLSETDLIDQGLIIELWNKGVLWVIFCSFAKINFAHKWIVANILLIQDKLLGVYYLDLKTVPYSQSHVKWLQINEEFETRLGIKWN